MSLNLQAKLLRVLQDGTFERLGGTETLKTDVRIIAATNRQIDEMITKGLFREDLYYRLNVVTIHLPPLRDRKEDIKELAAYFIQKYNKRIGKKVKGITAESLKKLEGHTWQGNVRELENTIQKAMVFCNSDYLSVECFDKLDERRICCDNLDDTIQQLADMAFKNKSENIFQDIVSKLERHMIKKALELTNGNQVHAARLLGISRNTLRKKLEEV